MHSKTGLKRSIFIWTSIYHWTTGILDYWNIVHAKKVWLNSDSSSTFCSLEQVPHRYIYYKCTLKLNAFKGWFKKRSIFILLSLEYWNIVLPEYWTCKKKVWLNSDNSYTFCSLEQVAHRYIYLAYQTKVPECICPEDLQIGENKLQLYISPQF